MGLTVLDKRVAIHSHLLFPAGLTLDEIVSRGGRWRDRVVSATPSQAASRANMVSGVLPQERVPTGLIGPVFCWDIHRRMREEPRASHHRRILS